MKCQVLFSLKNNEKNLCMLSAAVVIGALRVKVPGYIFRGNNCLSFASLLNRGGVTR